MQNVIANFKFNTLGIFNLFKKTKRDQPEKPEPVFEGPVFYYHEDDFRQVEIVPADYLDLKSENSIVDEFAKEHFDREGFSNMYVRKDDEKIKLNQLKINPEDLEFILETLKFDRVPNVFTGYGETYRQLHKDCVAFCKDYSAIFYDHENNVVQHIWLINHWSNDKELLSNCLHNLGMRWHLAFQDWNLGETINLQDKQVIRNYLETANED